MTFALLSPQPVPGAAITMEVSTDNFATTLVVDGVTQRWSTVTGGFTVPIVGSPLLEFDGRIISVGRHQRSLSADGLMAASTLSMVLDNTDGTFDWMTKPETVTSTLLKARFRVALSLFDPAQPTSEGGRLMGVFTCLDFPSRDESRVFLELADDALAAADIATPPSLLDWMRATGGVGGVAADFGNASGAYAGVDGNWGTDARRPLPLAFGSVRVPLLPTVRKWVNTLTRNSLTSPRVQCVLCCTTLDNLVGPPDSALFQLIPDKQTNSFPGPPQAWYSLNKSVQVTKSGKNWRIWFVDFDLTLMLSVPFVMNDLLGGQFGAPGALVSSVDLGAFWEAFWQACGGGISALAFPLSSHTYPPSFDAFGGRLNAAIPCSNVARDLIQQYSRGTLSVDATSFNDVAAANPGNQAAVYVGEIGLLSTARAETTVVTEAGQLRGVLRTLASSGQFDLSVLPDGRVRALANTATFAQYATASTGVGLTTLDETRIVADSLRLRTPSQGQRWAPYNRVYIETGGQRRGPFDHTGNIVDWGKPFTRVVDASYTDVGLTIGDVFGIGNPQGFEVVERQFQLESRVRPVVSFRYGPEAMALELGDFFQLSITRGGASFPDTYTDAIWKVESLNYLHETGQVEVEAVWVSDILTEVPFLLDDEALITRASSATYNGGGVTVSVLDDNVATFSAGNLTSAGVQAGDILVLQDGDANEASTEFAHNRGLRITVINSAFELTVSDTIRAVGGTIAISTWKILRGHTTYPTAISDPTNYPDGSRMYGKAADTKTAGVYSNRDTGNRLSTG